MLSRRNFMKYAGLAAFGYCMEPIVAQASGTEYVDVNIPEFRLRFEGKEYKVSIGKSSTPTPTGKGVIYEKIERPVFRYKDPGPNQGKIIWYTEDIKGRPVKVPYGKFRSMGIRINAGPKWGLTERYRIHSTTEYWNMGKPISDGCIRLDIPDMLDLYRLVPRGAEIRIRYDTVRMDDDGFIVFPDVYRKRTNTLEALERGLKEKGIERGKERLADVIRNSLGKYVRFSEI